MKKSSLFFVCLATILTVSRCTKITHSEVFEENGHQWQGWRINTPANVFDEVLYSIKIEDPPVGTAPTVLDGMTLVHDGPKVIYAVEPFVQGSFIAMKADVERRGWHVASLSYLIALATEYGIYETSTDFWNLYVSVPVPIDMGAGDECVVGSYSANRYNPATGFQYAMGIRFTPCATTYQKVAFLCYH